MKWYSTQLIKKGHLRSVRCTHPCPWVWKGCFHDLNPWHPGHYRATLNCFAKAHPNIKLKTILVNSWDHAGMLFSYHLYVKTYFQVHEVSLKVSLNFLKFPWHSKQARWLWLNIEWYLPLFFFWKLFIIMHRLPLKCSIF